MRIINFLLLALSVWTVKLKWTNAKNVVEMPYEGNMLLVAGVYTDPYNSVSHILCCRQGAREILYYAITEQGEVIHNNTYQDWAWGYEGAIKGADDGKHIYMAFTTSTGSGYYVNYTETNDGGATWKPFIRLTDNTELRFLRDLIYIPDTGRIFLFFTSHYDHQIKMVTKPRDSDIFSEEMLVVNFVNVNPVGRIAAYTKSPNNRIILHVFYIEMDNSFRYVNSFDNGITWSETRIINPGPVIQIIGPAYSPLAPQTLIVGITTGKNATLYKTTDNGLTFSEPILTNDGVYGTGNSGLEICNVNNKLVLASFLQSKKQKPEFAYWDLNEMKPNVIENPFEPWAFTAFLTCPLKNKVNAFTSQLDRSIFAVQYAQEINTDFELQ